MARRTSPTAAIKSAFVTLGFERWLNHCCQHSAMDSGVQRLNETSEEFWSSAVAQRHRVQLAYWRTSSKSRLCAKKLLLLTDCYWPFAACICLYIYSTNVTSLAREFLVFLRHCRCLNKRRAKVTGPAGERLRSCVVNGLLLLNYSLGILPCGMCAYTIKLPCQWKDLTL